MRLLSPNAAILLASFLSTPSSRLYGYELMQETGMKSGTLYPVLGRFERLGWITGEMQESPSGRPPRRTYILNPDGYAAAQAALDRYIEVKRISPADLLLGA